MFVHPELFLDAIVILNHDNGTRSQAAVTELILLYEEDNKTAIGNIDADLVKAYIGICKTLIAENICHADKDRLRTVLVRFKSDKAMEKRRDIYDLLTEVLLSPEKMTAAELKGHQDRVMNAIMSQRALRLYRQGFSKLSKAQELTDPEEQRAALTGALKYGEDITKIFSEATLMASGNNVETVDLKDKDSVKKSMTRFVDRTVKGVIKTGLQGLNRALGRMGGIGQGRSCVFNAMPHNYKSGILMSCAIWALLHNEPPVSPDGKPPLILFITLENEVDENIVWVFRKAYYHETKQSSDHLSDDEVIDWIVDFFGRKGWELRFERFLPANFGYHELQARVRYWKESGYNVVMTIVDYLKLARKGSSEKSSNAARDLIVAELFSNFCNFLKHNNITFVTAHPLNRNAMQEVTKQANAVARLGPEYLADSIDVEREVDISIYMYIEKNHAGEAFLTFKLTKHRYVDDTPEAHKIFAYKFEQGLGIVDDLNERPRYIKDIYAANFDDDGEQQREAVAVF